MKTKAPWQPPTDAEFEAALRLVDVHLAAGHDPARLREAVGVALACRLPALQAARCQACARPACPRRTWRH